MKKLFEDKDIKLIDTEYDLGFIRLAKIKNKNKEDIFVRIKRSDAFPRESVFIKANGYAAFFAG